MSDQNNNSSLQDAFMRMSRLKNLDMQDVLNRFSAVMADVTAERVEMKYDSERSNVTVTVGYEKTSLKVSDNSPFGTIKDIFERCFM